MKKERQALSAYRMEKADDMLQSAKIELHEEHYASASNRAYYCLFHAMRAVLAMDGEDFKKHSGVISRFSQNYLKPEIIPRIYGPIISQASLIRTKSDYEDFYTCSKEDAASLVRVAESFLKDVRQYLELRWKRA